MSFHYVKQWASNFRVSSRSIRLHKRKVHVHSHTTDDEYDDERRSIKFVCTQLMAVIIVWRNGKLWWLKQYGSASVDDYYLLTHGRTELFAQNRFAENLNSIWINTSPNQCWMDVLIKSHRSSHRHCALAEHNNYASLSLFPSPIELFSMKG